MRLVCMTVGQQLMMVALLYSPFGSDNTSTPMSLVQNDVRNRKLRFVEEQLLHVHFTRDLGFEGDLDA